MAHPQQQTFVTLITSAFPDYFAGVRVLEIGSLDINGSVRQYFSRCDYVGVDVGPGPGVDVVCQGQKYDAPDNSFDTVISCEVMEHNPFWRETFINMLRLCRPGGLVLVTCAGLGRPEHGTRRADPDMAPLLEWDYYRNLEAKDFRNAVPISGHFSAWSFFVDISFCDLFFLGFKNGRAPPEHASSVLRAIRRGYLLKNLRNWPAFKKRMLIRLAGEKRYMAGSLLPWKTNA